jgi:glutathione S-transferase
MKPVTLYGNIESGNCLKTLWAAQCADAAHDWVEVDIFGGETRSDSFLALNPAGQVPVLRMADGRTLAQSNAILLYLLEGTDLIPADPFQRAVMMQWLFWEQYSHEPYIAVRRSALRFKGAAESDLDPDLYAKGRRALGVMEMNLLSQSFMVSEDMTAADIALVAYTRVADEGGFDLSEFPAVNGWVRRVESALGIEHGQAAVHGDPE